MASACARFGAEEPAATDAGTDAPAAPPATPSDAGDPPADANDAMPTPGDGGATPVLVETFDTGCGAWAVQDTVPSLEPKARTGAGACHVCPGTKPASLRGTFVARRGVLQLSAWVRADVEGKSVSATVVAKATVPQKSGSDTNAQDSVTTGSVGWTELTLGVLPLDTAEGATGSIVLEITNQDVCLSVDDLIVR